MEASDAKYHAHMPNVLTCAFASFCIFCASFLHALSRHLSQRFIPRNLRIIVLKVRESYIILISNMNPKDSKRSYSVRSVVTITSSSAPRRSQQCDGDGQDGQDGQDVEVQPPAVPVHLDALHGAPSPGKAQSCDINNE